jgi:DNA helicase-4
MFGPLSRVQARTVMRRWVVPWSSIFFARRWWLLRRYRALLDGKDQGSVRGTGLNLNLAQREAVIAQEPTTLVIAAAGSGKTAVVVAKVAYLLATKRATPESILLLAFNRDDATEIQQRCANRFGLSVEATTFHPLGRSILKAQSAKTLRLSLLAEDPRQFATFLNKTIIDLGQDPKFVLAVNRLVRIDRSPAMQGVQFDTLAAYEKFTRTTEPRALNGTLVKSRGELEIANHLYIRGVKFEYEKAISDEVPGAPNDYRPDFYLPEQRVWIEFFGIDREGHTAPGIDRIRYQMQRLWKEAVHKKLGTKFIALYSWQHREGSLLHHLEAALRKHQVEEKPRDPEELLRELSALDWRSTFSDLVAAFLKHFRENGLTLEEVRRRASEILGLEGDRARAFVEAFGPICTRYAEHLKAEGSIDFADMIASAALALRSGVFQPRWTHIIVDEFQDISSGRYRFLAELLRARPSPKLLAVGDDWQSINRFAGSDTTIMLRAEHYFRRPVIVFLGQTYRFGQRLAEISSTFITRNPEQIRKKVTGYRPEPEVSVAVWWTAAEHDAATVEVVRRLAADDPCAAERSLVILARYQEFLPDRKLQQKLADAWPGELCASRTIHAAKGFEADYVIVLEVRDVIPRVRKGRLAIPSGMTDDPLLSLVMPEKEIFEHAEERRLFYVALTRAKLRVDLVCHREAVSSFARELATDERVRAFGRPVGELECAKCRASKRQGRIVWPGSGDAVCNNPLCHVRLPECPLCHNTIMVPDAGGQRLRCSDALCDGEAEVIGT